MSKEAQESKSRLQSYEKILESYKDFVIFLSIFLSFRIIGMYNLIFFYQNNTELEKQTILYSVSPHHQAPEAGGGGCRCTCWRRISCRVSPREGLLGLWKSWRLRWWHRRLQLLQQLVHLTTFLGGNLAVITRVLTWGHLLFFVFFTFHVDFRCISPLMPRRCPDAVWWRGWRRCRTNTIL